jgi:trk system potassium uptake protein TrkA
VHLVILGCGRVGSTLAHALVDRGHSVAIIDQNPEAFRRLGDSFSGETVTGNGFDRDTLTTAGIVRAGALAAVSSGDNSNIITARVARETFGVDRVVARIYDPGRAEVYARLGIPTVATVRWTSDQILRALLPEGLEEVWRDPSSSVAIVEFGIHTGWVGRSVRALEEATGTRVAYVVRFGNALLPTPSGAVQDGDRVFMLVTDDITERVSKIVAGPPEGGQ